MSSDETNPYEAPTSRLNSLDSSLLAAKVPNKRVTGFLIDYFLVSVVALMVTEMQWLMTLLAVIYMLVRDAVAGGQSIGKWVVGLKVVQLDGAPCNLWKSFIRNITVVIPFIVIVEYLVMRMSEDGGRLGDRFAGTVVRDLRPHQSDWWFLLLPIVLVVAIVLLFVLTGVPR